MCVGVEVRVEGGGCKREVFAGDRCSRFIALSVLFARFHVNKQEEMF